jgi:8-oxo-dGTP pyrophosphatase MutT (NUDIX family)
MGRVEFYNDPEAPEPNTLIPACNLLVVDEAGRILLQRRRDTGQWALPGGAQELGESPSDCAVRECKEETGIDAEVTGILGIYSDPLHIVAYTDGEVRQQYEVTLIGRPVGGRAVATDEASDAQWFEPDRLRTLDIHVTMRRQIDDYLHGRFPHVD